MSLSHPRESGMSMSISIGEVGVGAEVRERTCTAGLGVVCWLGAGVEPILTVLPTGEGGHEAGHFPLVNMPEGAREGGGCGWSLGSSCNKGG